MIYLYEFYTQNPTMQPRLYTVTPHEDEISVPVDSGVVVYQHADIMHDRISFNAEVSSAELKLSVPIDSGVATLLDNFDNSTNIRLKIHKITSVEQIAGLKTIFCGYIKKITKNDNVAEIVVGPITDRLLMEVPINVYSKQCPYAVYNSDCKVNTDTENANNPLAGRTIISASPDRLIITIDGNTLLDNQLKKRVLNIVNDTTGNYIPTIVDYNIGNELHLIIAINDYTQYPYTIKLIDQKFSIYGWVEEIGEDKITIKSASLRNKPSDWFKAGIINFVDVRGYFPKSSNPLNAKASRTITKHERDTITMMGVYTDLQVGDAFVVLAGCDGSANMCQTKFNNYVNYGGFPYIPSENIYVQGVA